MRKDFNWSFLDRSNLYSMLYSLGKEVVGKKIEIKELQKLLSTHIKSHLPVKVVRKQNDSKQRRGLVYMGGTYYADYDAGGNARFIEVVLSYHPLDEKVKITEYRWSRLCQLFSDTILHEVIHMRQYRSRNFKTIPGYESTAHYHKQRMDQEYYGHRDEMGAFSFNIACDMLERFDKDTRAIQDYLDSKLPNRKQLSTWHQFLKAFEGNHNHQKVRQMKRKILKQLEYADIGRPFHTNNYLTY
jgi:hypothetical protein